MNIADMRNASIDWQVLPFVVIAALAAVAVAFAASRRTWPWSLALPPIALGAWWAMTREGMIVNYSRWLDSSAVRTIGAAGVLVLVSVLWLRGRSLPRAISLWIVGSAAFLGAMTLPPREYDPFGGEGVASCFVGMERWLPQDLGDVFTDLLPNLALFSPLGFGLFAAGLNLRKVAATALVLSCGIELVQATLTSRQCAPRDVAVNVVGCLVGAVVLWLLGARGEHRPGGARSLRQAHPKGQGDLG